MTNTRRVALGDISGFARHWVHSWTVSDGLLPEHDQRGDRRARREL